MVTTESMRHFAADCLSWAGELRDPSQRENVLATARFWTNTANAIDRFVANGFGDVLPNLKAKLN